MAAAFQHVEEAGEIGIEIGVGILQRVAHAGLGGEMHHRPEAAAGEELFGGGAIGQIEAMKGEAVELPESRQPSLLERRIVIGIEAVDPDDRPARCEQALRETEADEACGAGDENGIGHEMPVLGPPVEFCLHVTAFRPAVLGMADYPIGPPMSPCDSRATSQKGAIVRHARGEMPRIPRAPTAASAQPWHGRHVPIGSGMP